MFFIAEYNKGNTHFPTTLPENLRNSIWNAGQQQQQQQASASATTVSGPFAITADELSTDTSIFQQNNVLGFIEGSSAVNLLSQSGLGQDQLGQVSFCPFC